MENIIKVKNNNIKIKNHNVELVSEIPMEDINFLVDLLDKSEWREGAFDTLEWIGSGTFGRVYGYKDYAIKQFKDINDDNNDVEVLKTLKHLECIPTLYAVIDNEILIMERIHGMTVRDYCNYGKDENNKYQLDWSILNDFDNSLLNVIREGYSPHDMHETNVMIDSRTRKPKLVDVGFFRKHNEEYDNFDIHTIKNSDRGYSNANNWAGRSLRNYLDDQNQKLLHEADNIWAKHDVIFMKGDEIKIKDMNKYHELMG